MNNKEKALWLSEFYKKLAENDNGISHETVTNVNGPYFGMDWTMYSNYTVNPPKPKKKIIDLSMMVGSGIDMEFSNGQFLTPKIQKLKHILERTYVTAFGNEFDNCRIRQAHWHNWHSWGGSLCPLPRGLEVKLRFITDTGGISHSILDNYRDINWDNVIAFRVLGPAENAQYEWDTGSE